MNKTITAALLLTVGMGAGVVALLPAARTINTRTIDTRTIDTSSLRLAIADRPCPVEGEAGYPYLKNHCLEHRTVNRGDGYCLCLTTDTEPLTGEMDLADLPAAVVRRYVSCRYKDSESGDPTAWRTSHRWARLNESPPATWTNVSCRVILPRELNLSVQANVTGQLILALKDQCGDWVTPTSWACCPDCLHYPAGCPPCPGICKYGPQWPSHEAECL